MALTGTHVLLEPMRTEHAAALLQAGRSMEVWEFMPARPMDAESMDRWMAKALANEAAGREHPFIVRRRADGVVIGSTRYLDVQEEDRTAEIGWTWYAPSAWGTMVNPEAKYLLLRHAFEDWRAIRVALKTDIRNLHSQAAIKKLGAVFEGTLRNQRIRPDGTYRDTPIYSIIESEWPEVKRALEIRLAGTDA
ncbi:MAG: GNAT family N-acetyltransferase [Candidatus Dormibacteraeota bacterium]|nr:GNAT family N-acetyltransferase [Candidatus Dormibacteraeota bacterium]